MRKSNILSILTVLLVGGGVSCFVYAARDALWMRGEIEVGLFGSVLFLLGAASGLTALASLRRECRRLTEQVRRIADEGLSAASEPLDVLESSSHELSPLIDAMNDLTEAAEKSVGDANLRAKELEIELKVATAERQHAEAIIYSISDAVLVTDPFDEVVLANESAAKTFNFKLENAARAPMEMVLDDPKLVDLIRDVRQSQSRNGRRIVEHKITIDGATRTFKLTLSCVTDQDENPAGVVAVMHDMTREKELADMKNDFVSSVSHELRTPLASIKAYVEMLIDGEANDERTTAEFYEVIQNEANRLSRLIDNILNISRIESGLVHVQKHPQSLTVVMKEAIEVIAPQARLKRITLTEKLTPMFYQTLGDKDMLYQAVLNLLGNAVKYTPAGGTITIETSVDECKKKVLAKIADTGVGIPPKDLPFVFDKFFRSEANNHIAKGTGLGLSLVKHIIETVHKGRTFVESEPGKGSCFGFEMDLME